MNKKLKFPPRPSSIVALCIISESEIVKVMPNYSAEFENQEIRKGDILLFASVGAGMNINAFVYKY